MDWQLKSLWAGPPNSELVRGTPFKVYSGNSGIRIVRGASYSAVYNGAVFSLAALSTLMALCYVVEGLAGRPCGAQFIGA